ncbi:MAG: ribonuclease III [Candidatus Saganbacteria bacterium]|nr:ribonuclease III [Candidatus Saganbacteria bacterium]
MLKLIMSEYLFNKFPAKQEGDLTKIRSATVSDVTLANIGRQLGLGDYLLLGSNEARTGGRRRRSNIANAFESILGAIYLDSGIGKARDFVISAISEEVEKVSTEGFIRDYKSALQEISQKEKWGLPLYRVVKESGPKHKRVFWVQVKVKNRVLGLGRGGSKKDAEQRAASFAYEKIKKEKKLPEEEKAGGIKELLGTVRKGIRFRLRKEHSDDDASAG